MIRRTASLRTAGLILVLGLVFSGCSRAPVGQTLEPGAGQYPAGEGSGTPTGLPSAERTLVPESTAQAGGSPDCAYPTGEDTGTLCYMPELPGENAADGKPGAFTEEGPSIAYPGPEGAATAEKPVMPLITATPDPAVEPADGAPFQNCAVTPGIAGCDPQAEPFDGLLSFFDARAHRLVTLDLLTGEGWQAPSNGGWMRWSPEGDQLLVDYGMDHYALYGRTGDLIRTFESEFTPQWLSNNQLNTGEMDIAIAEDGRKASLAYVDEKFVLQIETADGTVSREITLHPQPADRLYSLRSWVPGTDLLLAQTYSAGNAAITMGGQLITIDSNTGMEQDLDATAPLGTRGIFAWNPAQSGLLAFLASSSPGGLNQGQLALFDFRTGQLRYPLPDGVDVGDLEWRPDGSLLAFAVTRIDPQQGPGAPGEPFDSEGIYLLDPQTGEVQAVTNPAPNVTDRAPHWDATGQTLLFQRTVETGPAQAFSQVLAHRMRDGQESILVDGLVGDIRLEITYNSQTE